MDSFDVYKFRNDRKRRLLVPYENFGSTVTLTHISQAKKALSNGWIRKGLPAVKLDESVPWEESFKINRSWSFHLHCWEILHDLLMAYSETHDSVFLAPCLRVAHEWISKYPSLDTTSHFAWYDMAVGIRAQRLSYLLDVVSRLDNVDDRTVQEFINSLYLHKRYLENEKNIIYHNNHGFYQIAGQLAMSRRFVELFEMRNVLKQAINRFRLILSKQFTDEKIHKEHSPDYHRMVYHSLSEIIKSGLIENQPEIFDLASQIEENLAWFVLPNGYLVNFGDSDYRNMNRGLTFAKKWDTPAMKFIASGGKEGTPPNENYKAFSKSGYFIVRDPWPLGAKDYDQSSYLAQTLCFHSRTHKHADDLSFIWYDRGNEILVDAGRYGYLDKTDDKSELARQGYWYANPNRIFVEETRAHNTVEIDGKSYPRVGIKPYGSALHRYGKTNQGLYYSDAHVYHFKSIRHARVLIFCPREWLLVYDWLWDNKKEPHNFRQWFHFAPNLNPLIENNRIVVDIPDSSPLHVASLLPDIGLSEVYIGETTPHLQGWWSPQERTMIPNPAIAFEKKGTPTMAFATLFSFNQKIVPDYKNSKVSISGRKANFFWINEIGNNELIIERPEAGQVVIQHVNK